MLRAAEVSKAALPKAIDRQHAAAARRLAEQAGDAAGALRRGQSQRAAAGRARRCSPPRTDFTVAVDDAAVPGAGLRRCEAADRRSSRDFLNLFFFQREEGIGGVLKALAGPRLPAEPGRAQSDCLQRPGSELPRRRRNSDSGGQGITGNVSVHLQGIRHPPELQADDRRRRDPPEAAARSQHARFQQRRHPRPASGFRRSTRAAPRPTSSCATASRSRSPA